ncbi:MAG TPA: cache domain-containing protein [Solirubrobacter sp.]|nr:cache domain-containing protein [Solirubrobacter sp.]
MRRRACALIALLALAGCGGDERAERAGSLAEAAAAEVDAVLADARTLLERLARDPAVAMPDLEHAHDDDDPDRELAATQADSRRRCTAAVRRAASDRYVVVGRATVDGAGKVDCLSRRLDHAWNVGDRMFFLRAYNSARFAVGDYQFDGAEIRPSLGVGLPIEGAVLFALVDLRVVSDRLAALPLPEGADLVAVDGNGTVIVRPQTAYAVGRNQAGADPLIDALLATEPRAGTYEYERRERTYAFATPALGGGAVRVAAGLPR